MCCNSSLLQELETVESWKIAIGWHCQHMLNYAGYSVNHNRISVLHSVWAVRRTLTRASAAAAACMASFRSAVRCSKRDIRSATTSRSWMQAKWAEL